MPPMPGLPNRASATPRGPWFRSLLPRPPNALSGGLCVFINAYLVGLAAIFALYVLAQTATWHRIVFPLARRVGFATALLWQEFYYWSFSDED